VVDAFLLSVGVIAVAELGDKSQLMALAFATRYPALQVLVGISAATLVVHAFSVLVGSAVALLVPPAAVSIIAGLAFFAFSAWTLRGDELGEQEEARARRSARSVVLAVGVAFFLAELGDKTMLATMTLASTEDAIGTWLGSTVGMVLADAIAIGVGALLGSRLPQRPVKIGAAMAFAVFGAVLVAEGIASI
jgi:putative Ca2+/H+ antiporter (TMEM165/GDT1 family)